LNNLQTCDKCLAAELVTGTPVKAKRYIRAYIIGGQRFHHLRRNNLLVLIKIFNFSFIPYNKGWVTSLNNIQIVVNNA
jgi:hypothetical protein